MIKEIKANLMYFGLIIALAGVIGSLYFSEIMGLTPCVLCWYQRIALYPLVAIFAIGIIKKTQEAWLYALPMMIVGWLVALYNILLVYGAVKENNFTCSTGVPCAEVTWSMFGFINIPLLSFLAFTILILMYCWSKQQNNNLWQFLKNIKF